MHRRQPADDLLRGQSGGDIEEHPAVLGTATGLDLGIDRSGNLVARQQLRWPLVVLRIGVPAVGFLLGLGVVLAKHVRDVVEHEPLALGVAQHATVTTYRLGDQDALHRRRPHHAGRVELDELHVEQAGTGPQREGVAVAGVLPGVRGDLEGLADTAGREHHCRRSEQHEPAGFPPVAERAGDRAGAVLQQLGDRQLGEDRQVGVRGDRLAARGLLAAGSGAVVLLQRDDFLLQGADQLQAGPVTDVRQPRVLVPAEVALADLAFGGPIEQRPVGLQLPDPVRCLFGVQLGHPWVVEELAAAHGVAKVHLPVVVRVGVTHRGGDAPLGHHRVGLAEQRLADDRGPHACLAGGDCGPQPGTAGADDHDVVTVFFVFGHQALVPRSSCGGG